MPRSEPVAGKSLFGAPILLLLGLVAAAAFSTTHTLIKYTPQSHKAAWVLLGLLTEFGAYALVLRLRKSTLFENKWIFCALVLCFFVAVAVIYPIADGLKLHHAGSDQDDSIKMAVDQLKAFSYPYRYYTYLGDPISPGPGWVLLNFPITALGLYQFTGPLLVGLSALYLRNLRKNAGTIFLLLLACTPPLCEAMVIGSDSVALGCTLMLLGILAYRAGPRTRAALAILIGFVATARVNLISFPIALYLLRRDRTSRRAIWETVAAVVVALLLHVSFMSYAPQWYTPIHLIGKGQTVLSQVPYMMPVFFVVTVLYLFLVKIKSEAAEVTSLGWYFFAMHSPPALGLLRLQNFDWITWDGYIYMLVGFPCFVAAVALYSASPRECADETITAADHAPAVLAAS